MVADDGDEHGDDQSGREAENQEQTLTQTTVELGTREHNGNRGREQPQQHGAPEHAGDQGQEGRNDVSDHAERRARHDHRGLTAALTSEGREAERNE